MLPVRLRQLRKARGLTQEELASKVNTKKTTISNYETGYSTPSNEMLIDLADALHTSTDYLLGRSDNPDGATKQNEINIHDDSYDSLAEINQLIKQYGIEQIGFFDVDKWKNLSPQDVKMIEEHFKMVVKLAEVRNEEKNEGARGL